MIYKVSRPPKSLHTSVCLPASKSISNRLLVIHSLSENSAGIDNLSDSDDTVLMNQALLSDEQVKNIGHAGTAMRFLTAFYSCREGSVTMTGSDRMKERPIGPLVDALRELGAEISYAGMEGFPPLEIHGKTLKGGKISIKGSISSQFISALLMVAPAFKNGLTLVLMGEVVSSSYISMTLKLMEQYGAEVDWIGDTITVAAGGYQLDDYSVESDWSAASYWYAMMLPELHAHLWLSSLEQDSLQGDSDLMNIFQKLGVLTEFDGNSASLHKVANIIPSVFEYDFTNSPDLVQSMAVILSLSSIPFRFTGTQTLRIKETDRIAALQIELKKLSFILNSDESGSYLEWDGERCDPEKNPVISTYHDHRMAMAFVPVALILGEIQIDDPMVVSKSYPAFWEDLKKAGFGVEAIPATNH
jgi:3-phosphoshikimate 1-carboxyvinyltransferase